jgi:hypothetical protein
MMGKGGLDTIPATTCLFRLKGTLPMYKDAIVAEVWRNRAERSEGTVGCGR